MAEVVGLRGCPIPESLGPDPDLTEKLESLLEQARTGKIRGMAFVVVDVDETIETGCVGGIRTMLCLSGVAMLQYRMMQTIDNDD